MMVNLHKKWVVLMGVIGVIGLLFVLQTKGEQTTKVVEFEEEIEENSREKMIKDTALKGKSNMIMIDIKGAVLQEGVYELKSGSRVKDGIAKAGGFSQEADKSKVNLAQVAQDEMMIYVPKIGEQVQGAAVVEGEEEQKIHINLAEKEELERIPGIGPQKAENIMRHREEHGLFQKLDDLLEVDGIGEKSLEKIKDHIIIP
ncbi:competence protein ComE [Bacillus manliponensis]|uniref:Competence protein ComE n=1 Tax=Bacillus manliponensis TaxID=574376 RepID=A0A073JWV9_9BACI|nr:helix-hairpin-helix domain-containing protein [Bacillus manliponensis]KEK19469.1 competence protein ComE [Bacillus manliponensis]